MTEADACGLESKERYSFPSTEEWETDAASIGKQLKDFLMLNGVSEEASIVVREGDIADIALRVDKRRSYYRYFHSIEISERKTSALIAYWIIKFHPIIIEWDGAEGKIEAEDDFRCFINEHFAAYLLIAPCLEGADKIEKLFGSHGDAYDRICSSDYYQKLVYSLRYRNISIDAFVLLAESIVPEVFLQKFEDRL